MAQITNILCPVDFFPASERALDFAIPVARRHQAKLTLLHVVSPIFPGAYEVPMDIDQVIRSATMASSKALKALAAKIERLSVPCECVTLVGYVDDEIQAYVAKHKPSMLVMGTHGRRGVERWFLGSTTERMMRRLSVPMLIVGVADHDKPSAMSSGRILVASDLSEGTAEAMNYASSLAYENRSQIILLHALNDIAAEINSKYREPLLHGVRSALTALVPQHVSTNHMVDIRVAFGTPYQLIAQTINEEKIGFVVMNVHPKSDLERFQAGPTVEHVLRTAACPILIVPTGNKRQEA